MKDERELLGGKDDRGLGGGGHHDVVGGHTGMVPGHTGQPQPTHQTSSVLSGVSPTGNVGLNTPSGRDNHFI